jgi:hypothetical protein
MVRNLDRAPFTTIRQTPAPVRAAKSGAPDRAAGFRGIFNEQSRIPTTPTPLPLKQAVPAPVAVGTPVPTAIPTAGASLHTVAALPNGGRMVDPTGNNTLYGGLVHYNPDYYATFDAAAELAAQLGGVVVDNKNSIQSNQPQYCINLPNGIQINAGNLLRVLNNPFFQQNSRMMDAEIATVLNNNAIGTPAAGVGLYTVVNGQVTFDPNGRPAVYPVQTT